MSTVEASPPVSLEDKLREKWEMDRADAESTIEQADYNLGRISLIYGGQLSFDLNEVPYRPEAA